MNKQQIDSKIRFIEQYMSATNAATVGVEYWCTNIKITICNECNNIDKRTLYECPACKSTNIDWGTRVIGYLKRVSAFAEPKRIEETLRHYTISDSTS